MSESAHVFGLDSVLVPVGNLVYSSVHGEPPNVFVVVILHLDYNLLVLVDLLCLQCQHCRLPQMEVNVVVDSNFQRVNVLESSQDCHLVGEEQLNSNVHSDVFGLSLFQLGQGQGTSVDRGV